VNEKNFYCGYLPVGRVVELFKLLGRFVICPFAVDFTSFFVLAFPFRVFLSSGRVQKG
jgi:hypothetical protein